MMTTMPDVSLALHILQHSLGLDQFGQGSRYRNRFVTGPGTKDWDACRAMVADGLMVERAGSDLSGGDSIFMVTPAGDAFVVANSPRPPKVSRGRARYLRFLEYGDSFDSFREFLRWDSSPERSWNAAR